MIDISQIVRTLKNMDWHEGRVINNADLSEISSELLETFKLFGVVVIPSANLDDDSQLSVACALGDIFGWVPNSAHRLIMRYEEDHSFTVHERMGREPDDDEILDENVLVPWHLEHPGRIPRYAGAVWRMKKNISSENAGLTGFVDACTLMEKLPEEDISFLRLCEIAYSPENLLYESLINDSTDMTVNTSMAIERHPTRRREFLRITPMRDGDVLYRFNGDIPDESKNKIYKNIKQKITNLVWTDKTIQFWLKWEEGDVAVVDLLAMHHAVSGGFSIGERILVGYHCLEA